MSVTSIIRQHTQGVKTQGNIRVKKSKLDRPHIKKQVIQRLALGESQMSIAKDVGLDRSQVSRFARREDVKAFIEEEQMKLVEAVPDAVENVKQLVREMPNIPKKDIKSRELSYKASHDILKAVGIMPTPVQSQFIVNLNKQTNIYQDPLVKELLQRDADLLINWKPEKKDETP